MSENPLSITKLNDFIFCPASIYFHLIDNETETLTYQDSYQINGKNAHKSCDYATYSNLSTCLQGISVYSEKYNLFGKIDLFDAKTGVLIERKKKIKTIFDGYIFQLYAQCFSLEEMGYNVKEIKLYSIDDNKMYPICMPYDDLEKLKQFEKLLDEINSFSFDSFNQQNGVKCAKCIYEPLCTYSALEE